MPPNKRRRNSRPNPLRDVSRPTGAAADGDLAHDSADPATQLLDDDRHAPLEIGGRTRVDIGRAEYDRLLAAADRDAQREATQEQTVEDEADAAFRPAQADSLTPTELPDSESLEEFAAHLPRETAPSVAPVEQDLDEDPFEAFTRLPRPTRTAAPSRPGSAALAATSSPARHTRRSQSQVAQDRRRRLRFGRRPVVAILSAIVLLAVVTVLVDRGHRATGAQHTASPVASDAHPFADPLLAARTALTPGVDARIEQRRIVTTAARARRARQARAAAAAARARRRRLEQRLASTHARRHTATSSAPAHVVNTPTSPQTTSTPTLASQPTSTATPSTSTAGSTARASTTSSSHHHPLYGAHGSAGLGHTG